jgi:FSR family fosmidomycin resistance protein-like MFS transporter
MTEATEALTARAIRPAESRLIAGVCAAHMMSHYYMMMLAPLFAFIRDDFDVSYTQLGLALTVFNLVSGAFQTPVGFLVDRIGARPVLLFGLFLSSASYAIAGVVGSFWVFVAMYGVAGLGNTVYHPADYSLLSRHTPSERIGQIFSFHTFAGMIGSAVAPATLLYMQSQFGWRGAYIGAAILGLLVLIALVAQPEPVDEAKTKAEAKAKADAADTGWRMLLSTPILLNLTFFILISLMGSGLNTYLVVALTALHGTPTAIANVALTSLLAMSAAGTLVGGILAGRTSRHATVAALGLTIGGIVTGLVGLFNFGPVLLVIIMGFSGFCAGITYPSRDMLVRAVTPPGAFGKVFGFVSTGFNIGASIAPIMYGMLMDNNEPRAVFLVSAAVSILCVSTVTFGLSGRKTY